MDEGRSWDLQRRNSRSSSMITSERVNDGVDDDEGSSPSYASRAWRRVSFFQTRDATNKGDSQCTRIGG